MTIDREERRANHLAAMRAEAERRLGHDPLIHDLLQEYDLALAANKAAEEVNAGLMKVVEQAVGLWERTSAHHERAAIFSDLITELRALTAAKAAPHFLRDGIREASEYVRLHLDRHKEMTGDVCICVVCDVAREWLAKYVQK
jgi:hypothetical protein